jgi:hypothetical protein
MARQRRACAAIVLASAGPENNQFWKDAQNGKMDEFGFAPIGRPTLNLKHYW